MSCLSSYRQAVLLDRLAKKDAQLTKAYSTLDALLDESIEEYRFDSSEASQRAKRRKLSELEKSIYILERQIDSIVRKLNCQDLINLTLRRKYYGRFGRYNVSG